MRKALGILLVGLILLLVSIAIGAALTPPPRTYIVGFFADRPQFVSVESHGYTMSCDCARFDKVTICHVIGISEKP